MENVKSIKKIDIHAHATAFPQYYPARSWGSRVCGGEEMITLYDKLGVEKGVLLSISSPEAQMAPLTSENSKYVADMYPDRFLWFCNVDPRADGNSDTCDLEALLYHYKNLGAKGVGELTSNIYADDPKIDNLFTYCEKLKLPVTIHIGPQIGDCYGIVDELGLPRIEKMLKKHPDMIMLGHSQPFWSEISADNTDEIRNTYPTGKVKEGRIAQLMREYGNLYCDISAGSGLNALKRDPEYAAKFIEEFADRILFGYDICWIKNTHQFECNEFFDKLLDDGMISPENYYKIVRGNAVKLLGIGE